MYKVEIVEEGRWPMTRPNDIYRETVTAKDETHAQAIREAARKSATVGSSQTITVTAL
jgi:hypothetical protein